MTLKLEVGKYYKNLLGKKVGPLTLSGKSRHPYSFGVLSYTDEGDFLCWAIESPHDLVSEWTEEDEEEGTEVETKVYKKLSDMTPEEIGELVIARNSGKVIQAHREGEVGFAVVGPLFNSNNLYYRIKPEPVVEIDEHKVLCINGEWICLKVTQTDGVVTDVVWIKDE